jgi:lipopolysaccharide transport system permease protein
LFGVEGVMGRDRFRARHWRDVVVLLVQREYKGKYKHTKVGMAWTVISPLMYLIIFYFLFTRIINLQIPHYGSFVFTGIIVWGWTQGALNQAVGSISGNPGLVNQPGFPIAALPVVAVTSTLVNLLITLPLLLVLMLGEGVHLSLAMLGLPVVMAVQFLFILGAAYVVAAANVTLRDIEHALPILLQLGYYVTPVFFKASRAPSEFSAFFAANPMAMIIEMYRGMLLDGRWPDWGVLSLIVLGSAVLLVVGLTYFERARYRFLEEL